MVRGLFLVGLSAALVTAGCSGGSDALNSPTAARLKGLAIMYLDCVATKGNSPASEAELKKHMRRVDAIQLNMAGFQRDKIDEAFVSLRDNQPFEVVYGVTPGTLGAKDAPIIAYEKSGVGGKKLAVNLSTNLNHVNEQQLQDLLKPKEPKK